MIESWRQMWLDRTNSIFDIDAPFGFVQLADDNPDDEGYSYPIIRWEQTARQGFVPNGDLEVSIHTSTYKSFCTRCVI